VVREEEDEGTLSAATSCMLGSLVVTSGLSRSSGVRGRGRATGRGGKGVAGNACTMMMINIIPPSRSIALLHYTRVSSSPPSRPTLRTPSSKTRAYTIKRIPVLSVHTRLYVLARRASHEGNEACLP